MRPERSESPPAENGTMKVIGLDGYCATTGSAERARIPAAAENRTGLRMAPFLRTVLAACAFQAPFGYYGTPEPAAPLKMCRASSPVRRGCRDRAVARSRRSGP